MWWCPEEPGWGLSIHQHQSAKLVATWLTYSPDRQPTWYTLQAGQWVSPTVYTGAIYKTTGTYVGKPFDSGQVGIVQVGAGTLTFVNDATGTYSFEVDGISDVKTIARLPF